MSCVVCHQETPVVHEPDVPVSTAPHPAASAPTVSGTDPPIARTAPHQPAPRPVRRERSSPFFRPGPGGGMHQRKVGRRRCGRRIGDTWCDARQRRKDESRRHWTPFGKGQKVAPGTVTESAAGTTASERVSRLTAHRPGALASVRVPRDPWRPSVPDRAGAAHQAARCTEPSPNRRARRAPRTSIAAATATRAHSASRIWPL